MTYTRYFKSKKIILKILINAQYLPRSKIITRVQGKNKIVPALVSLTQKSEGIKSNYRTTKNMIHFRLN